MASNDLAFLPYEQTAAVPNIVVDGSPNDSTVLTLTHWPGIAQPAGLGADLSAQMAFNYLDHLASGETPAEAQVVTNNHFDQDGLVCVHALVYPVLSQQHREQLIDVAASGDFATYRFRESARASMAIWSYANAATSPLGSQLDVPYEAQCALLYETVLPLLIPMLEDPDRFRDLWADEDDRLQRSETAIADGSVAIEEVGDLDLAVVSITGRPLGPGHRFASDSFELIHPMAVNNATDCCRLLISHGNHHMYVDRYETWVQFHSRDLPQRVDLRPLQDQLDILEPRANRWEASPPSALTPRLASSGASGLDAATIRQQVVDYLRTAPAAWNPYV